MARIPHPSGVPNAYATDRADDLVVFPERSAAGQDVFITGMDLNDAQRVIGERIERVAGLVARDGDIQEGAAIVVTRDASPATTVTVALAAGRIYTDGDTRSVPARTITGVAGVGEVRVGIRIVTDTFDAEDDPTLVGPHPGTDAEGEPIGVRVVYSATWSLEDANEPGSFVPVYTLLDGVALDQTAPELTGVVQIISQYDFGANGHYIVRGCEVRALGRTDGKQRVSIGAGEANILGFKRVRDTALVFEYDETPDLELISSEPHTYAAATGQPTTVTVNRPPINDVVTVVITKRRTVDIVRGVNAGGMDELPDAAIEAIESVVQGGTTYAAGTYTLSGDNISWAPAGAEPAASSTYSVTYRYYEAQAPISVTDTTIVVSGGVNGRPIFVTYNSKIPRIDLVAMDINGAPVLVRGISSRVNPSPPQLPDNLLRLATLRNTWMPPAPYLPEVASDGTKSLTYDELQKLFRLALRIADQFGRSELERNILSREPVAKAGFFTDAFIDDFRRDQGEAQTLAIVDGVLCLAVDAVDNIFVNQDWLTLPFTEQIIVRQDQRTSGMLINPYANFVQMPAGLKLEPPVDFFTTTQVTWTSPETRIFQAPPGTPPGEVTITEEVSEQNLTARFIRQRTVAFTIEGFGAGELLSTLTFDGRAVTPVGTSPANSNGEITGTFTIPANVPTGARVVLANGAAGSLARAIFVGDGTIIARVMRRVTLVTRAAPTTNPTIPQPTNPPTNPLNPTLPPGIGLINDGQQLDGGNDGGVDPLAQTFAIPGGFGRMIIGVDLWVHAIGSRSKGIRVQLCTVENGIPTGDILAEDFIPMTSLSIQPGSMIQARFRIPVYCDANRQYAFVVMTDDNAHALKVARLGDVVDLGGGRQTRVGAQPYSNGVLLASADRRTWTPVQEADLAFRIVAANFTSTTRTVNLWTGPFDRITDAVVRSGIDIPEQGAGVVFEMVRASGQVIRFVEGQRIEFAEFVGPTGTPETVTLRAVLTGNARVSPTIFPGTMLLTGRIRTSGTYVTKVFQMGASATLRAVLQQRVPAGGTVTIEADAADDSWQAVAFSSQSVLGDGWNEAIYSRSTHAAANGGRMRITFTGGPAARVFGAKFRAYSIV